LSGNPFLNGVPVEVVAAQLTADEPHASIEEER
jgi:hypothetical protein